MDPFFDAPENQDNKQESLYPEHNFDQESELSISYYFDPEVLVFNPNS